ncbi:hypothetical protein HETIRDRAFT_411164 [Heterobasidion irregulare TC 32-1]|uniref:Uncharacterized protein n=1 Tax=Heterobasidion irregulare (strain TC 32-1) TaxID=747525 RepID=W4JWF3_HETIT|nr:uncharacterized protein HETIRDRAFT_435843 [Heterobasidion irregulare TC 32-1]ETW77893.1 hypothetical protein HETIRDRAFT_411164 [Heterobasidion irregulare TC 32-1]
MYLQLHGAQAAGGRRGPPRSAACTGEDTNRQAGRIERGGVESDRDRDRDRDRNGGGTATGAGLRRGRDCDGGGTATDFGH